MKECAEMDSFHSQTEQRIEDLSSSAAAMAATAATVIVDSAEVLVRDAVRLMVFLLELLSMSVLLLPSLGIVEASVVGRIVVAIFPDSMMMVVVPRIVMAIMPDPVVVVIPVTPVVVGIVAAAPIYIGIGAIGRA